MVGVARSEEAGNPLLFAMAAAELATAVNDCSAVVCAILRCCAKWGAPTTLERRCGSSTYSPDSHPATIWLPAGERPLYRLRRRSPFPRDTSAVPGSGGHPVLLMAVKNLTGVPTSASTEMHITNPSDRLRNAVTAAVRVLGLYHVAAEAGVTHQTLRKYLDGSCIRNDTMAKLQRWGFLSREAVVTEMVNPPATKREKTSLRRETRLRHDSGG